MPYAHHHGVRIHDQLLISVLPRWQGSPRHTSLVQANEVKARIPTSPHSLTVR